MILRRLAMSLKEQNWTAIAIEFVLLVAGVFLGTQAANWNEARNLQERKAAALMRMHDEALANIDYLRKRLDVLPDIPTFAELGMNELDWMAFFGLVAPAGTPEPIIRKFNEAARLALTQADVTAKLATQQAAPIGNSPQEFAAEIRRELERHRKAAQAANIHID